MFGQSVTFTATVTNTGSGATPTGTVTFISSDSTMLTGGALTPVMGMPNQATATVTTSALVVGADTITAMYTNGDGNFVSGSGMVLQTVNKAGTITALTAMPTPAVAFGTIHARGADHGGGAGRGHAHGQRHLFGDTDGRHGDHAWPGLARHDR